jgi:hypothetical protein
MRRAVVDGSVGDTIVSGFNNAKNFMLFLECLAVLRRCGVQDGVDILIEAVRIASEEDLRAARRFLMSQLTRVQVEAINTQYGIDMRRFRWASPYAPNAIFDTWTWSE